MSIIAQRGSLTDDVVVDYNNNNNNNNKNNNNDYPTDYHITEVIEEHCLRKMLHTLEDGCCTIIWNIGCYMNVRKPYK